MKIKNNIQQLIQSLPESCKLIIVSKTQPNSVILEAYQTGHKIFGENKVQELVSKYEALPKDIEWHLIGHLQTNKVKYVAPFVHLIHSVDSWKLLQEINKQGAKNDRVVSCLLQIHIAMEETKYGFSESEVMTLLKTNPIAELAHTRITGLMGMATFTHDTAVVRKEFQTLKKLFDTLKQSTLPPNVSMNELSMGMSGDYPIAVEEGSTLVRIGTAIFGERNYSTQ
jgi:PLP dependent protein